MLRSRSNRQQRPSESTDERGGSNYGGYGQSSSSSMSIASGGDDDYGGYGGGNNNAQQEKKGGSSRWGGSAKKSRSSFSNRTTNNNNVWDRKTMGSTIKGHPNKNSNSNSTGWVLFSIAFIVILAMGGATIHYRKAASRLEHEVGIVKRRMKGHHLNRFHHDDDLFIPQDNDNNANKNNNKQEEAADGADDKNVEHIDPQLLQKIRTQKRNLEAETSRWTARTQNLENEILALQSQIDHLHDEEITSYESEVTAMQSNIQKEGDMAQHYKQTFIDTHKSGATGIIPGGPGHALVQRREIEKMDSLDDYEDYVQRREDALWDKIDVLVEKLGKESRREAVEWFGPGPHKVELEIEFPQYTQDVEPDQWPRVRGVFTIEMAPLDLMPIAVNLFMQQVHHKLWNGCSFVINAMHILQAGPHQHSDGANYNANLEELVSKFEKARLDKMPFQEYHADFPHGKYTLGYAGRPGGPDFYINKIDNSVNHGPGGQSHHDLHEEADPAFATLVGGMELLGQLSRVPTDHDKGALFLHPVAIVDSRVIATRPEEPVETQQQQQQQQQSGENVKSTEKEVNTDNVEQVEVISEAHTNEQPDQSAKKPLPAMGPSPRI